MWATITKPFAWLMRFFYELTGNYGLAVILFGLTITVILAPFMAKSKKSMMKTSRLQPQIQELQRKHAGNQQKLNAEMQELYRDAGVNPMSGCVWSLIPFPILIALYSVIRQPLSRMMFVESEVVTAIQDFFVKSGWYEIPAKTDAYFEIKLVNIMHGHWQETISHLQGLGLGQATDKLIDLNYKFIGLDLGSVPSFRNLSPLTWATFGLFLIPFISAGLSYVSMKISTATNPTSADPQAQTTANTMNLMMPVMSIWICFVMPAALGIYWIANSIFGTVRDLLLTKAYKKKIEEEEAEFLAKRSAREIQLETRKAESEAGATQSKKKIQAREAQQKAERKAALEKAERAARRERLGVSEDKPASQVGNRRYARGRAYVPDRFTNPENAEAATLAAAMESENAEAIDENVEDDVIIENAAVEEAEAVVEEAEELEPSVPVETSDEGSNN